MTKPTGGAQGRPISEAVAAKYAATKPLNNYPKKPVGLQAAGRKTWDDVWSSGRVNEEEYALVAEYCFVVDEVSALRKVVKSLDKTWEKLGTNGALMPHPAVAQLKDYRQMMLNLQRELIMSPASRVKANFEIEKQADKELEDYIKRNQARQMRREAGNG